MYIYIHVYMYVCVCVCVASNEGDRVPAFAFAFPIPDFCLLFENRPTMRHQIRGPLLKAEHTGGSTERLINRS